MLKMLAPLALIGATACAAPTTDSAICMATRNDTPALFEALKAHPETPDAVGEPATSIVITLRTCPGISDRRRRTN
jgi:hypothetical protein